MKKINSNMLYQYSLAFTLAYIHANLRSKDLTEVKIRSWCIGILRRVVSEELSASLLRVEARLRWRQKQ
jgi:hypothetical protein